jgi:adenine-specific DNA-methyltransferase
MEQINKGDQLSMSEDLLTTNISKLKELFPELVTEGKIDFEAFRSIFGDEVEEGEEHYRFTWAGKANARREAQKPSTGTLRPAPEESVDWDNTQNLYIEGDNLEVLKLLQKGYAGKVKMIYIDPPYNTGKDFVYKDNYKDNLRNYQEITGQLNEEGNKTSTNSDSDGRFHSNWLNMMYPRLRLARNLLQNDGAVFMSIDDNEVENLKKIGNEIFGEDNFVADIIWHKKYGAANDAKYFSDVHDHILVFAKVKTIWKPNMFERPEELNAKYKNKDNDPRGRWIATNLSVKTYSKSNDYVIEGPTGLKFSPPPSRAWVVSESKYAELLADNRITFGKEGTSRPYSKTFLSEVQNGIVPTTIWSYNDAGHNIGAKSEIRDLFSETTVPFDTPKPTKLLKRIINVGESEHKSDIVLDFFSGSGTTADAVYQFNIENGKKHQFIQVQLPEKTEEKSQAYVAGYKTIAEIGKERIRRAAKKIAEENPEKVKNLDLGFKVFKLDTSNIKGWDGNPAMLDESLFDAQDNIKTDRTEHDVLYEILLKYGLDLTLPIEDKKIDDKTVFSVGFGALFICLSDAITSKVAEGIGAWKEELQPEICRVVFKDSGFTDVEKTNSVQTLKRFGITEIKSI